jgi:low temperature requirement protein LtrA
MTVGGRSRAAAAAERFRENGTRTALAHVTVGALYGGVILFLLGVLGYQRRVIGQVSRLRMGATVLLAALAPIGALVPALVGFGMLAVVAVAVVAVEFQATHGRAPQAARLARLGRALAVVDLDEAHHACLRSRRRRGVQPDLG